MGTNYTVDPLGGVPSSTDINNELDKIQDALERTLSRLGDSINTMQADLDMNGNRIHNLPEPVNPEEPLRKQDFTSFSWSDLGGDIPSNLLPSNVVLSGEGNSQLNNDSGYLTSIQWNDLSGNVPNNKLPTDIIRSGENNSQLSNDSGYLTTISNKSVGDLSDVNTSGAVDEQVLSWDQTSGQWIPSTVAGGGGTIQWSDLVGNLPNNKIPTSVIVSGENNSQLNNDSGYITTESDPTVPSHVKNITTGDISNWNTAYGWGDHSTQGYLTNISGQSIDNLSDVDTSGASDQQVLLWDQQSSTWIPATVSGGGGSIQWSDLTGDLPNDKIPSSVVESGENNSQLNNDSGYISSESDPTVPNYVKNISSTDISQWNSAYSWGNHANQGYLTNVQWDDLSGDLPNNKIPSTVVISGDNNSQLNNDSNYATVSQIPTNNNQLTNGANYLSSTEWSFTGTGDFLPATQRTHSIGSSSKMVEEIYTPVINMSNTHPTGVQSPVGVGTLELHANGIKWYVLPGGPGEGNLLPGAQGIYAVGDATHRVSRFFGNDLRLRNNNTGLEGNSNSTLSLLANGIKWNILGDSGGEGDILPNVDATYSIGSSNFRLNQIFAQNGAINTSDEREKNSIAPIPDEWLDAWEQVNFVQYKWNNGERWHTGLIAQQVRDAFQNKGVDPFEIGLLCYDEWDDENTNRYGIRYDEAYAMECALMRRTQNRLEARLKKLEG